MCRAAFVSPLDTHQGVKKSIGFNSILVGIQVDVGNLLHPVKRVNG